MKNRILSLFLAVILLVGLLPTSVFAASTLDEAMAEVNIYARNKDLNWLTMNGAVKTQHYTYYNYTSVITGETKEIPAYCVDPYLYGVPALVPEGTAIAYTCSETVNDPKVCGIVSNGYPHVAVANLGLQSVEEAYYATKTALWCYILRGSWSVGGLGINPNLTGADREAAQRVLKATQDIYTRGMYWEHMISPKITAEPDRPTAYPVTIGGEEYYQQVFEVTTDTWANNQQIQVSIAGNKPEGTKILNMSNQPISTIALTAKADTGFYGRCKVVYPASSVEGQSGSVQLNFNADVVQYAIYYAICAQKDQYGNVQDYMLDTDPSIAIASSAISNYSANGETPAEPVEDTTLKIVKVEKGTNTPLPGAVFKVTLPDGTELGSFATGSDGTVSIPLNITGHFTVEEIVAPEWHLLSENATQHVNVMFGKTAAVTFEDAPYGNLRVEKMSDTGEPLTGVSMQIKNIATGAMQSAKTNSAGVANFNELEPGGYEVRELSGIEGWIADTDTVQTVSVVSGESSTVTIINKELPGLRIQKYDRKTMELMEGVTFEIFRDGASLGKFKTNEQGEILVTNAQPGTYLVQETDTGSDSHILDTTPQQIELKASDGIRQLVFFNDQMPGIHLIKVDSANLSKPIANALFEIQSVDGNFGPEEITTDEDGLIDLSPLPAGAYVVTEKQCEGYVIDDAQRIIQLDGNETAQFVFTNTVKPSMRIVKLSSDGTALPGVTFRIAKIEDGSRYLDRVTDSKGEIVISGLEEGVYSVQETATDASHILDKREYHVQLFAGKTSELVLENQIRPNLYVYKHDADTGAPVANTVFEVRAADGHSVDEIKTDASGRAELTNLLPGVYQVAEKSVPAPYLPDAPMQLITLYPNRDRSVYFENHQKPNLTVNKIDSVTGDPIKGTKFHVTFASGETKTGEINDLGYYYSDENGQFTITGLNDGWYKVMEVEPAAGYAIKEPATQECFIKAGTSKVLTFENTPLSALVVYKYDSKTGEAIRDAVFQIKYLSGTSGTGGTVIGTYKTSANGSFTVTNLKAGTYIAEELASDDGHVIDTAPQTAYISGKEQDVVELYFGNAPKGSLLVKKVDAATGAPLSDVEFMVTTSDGTVVGDANGKFVTDSVGSFTVSGITPGTTLVVKETRAKAGYVLDDTPQTAKIKAGQAVTLEFRNAPKGELVILKKDSISGKPLVGVTFKVTTSSGTYVADKDGKLSSNGIYKTDKNGQIIITDLAPDTYIVTELETIKGYTIDENTRSQTVVVNTDDTQTLTFYNTPISGILLHKVDAATGEGIYGATFILYDKGHNPIGQYTSDQDGYIYMDEGLEAGRYYIREIEAADGYVLDSTLKTVYVKSGETTEVTWKNTAITGQIQILKTSADYNSVNGWPAGTPIPNTEFEIYNFKSNKLMDTVKTNKNGIAISKSLPLGRYKIVESKAAENYGLDKPPIDVKVEFAGQIVKASMTNKSLYTNVSIKKTGYTEVMPGQVICYTFSDIANNSTTTLTSFYWRDNLPVNSVRLNKVMTGTWNVRGSYKVVYRTNLSGSTYHVLADNLSTAKNYVLDASAATLGLASNEYVVEVMFSFGVVPVNFRQVEAPKVYCNVLSGLSNGAQFTNQADVGGVYSGQWIMATSRWTTRVYAPSKPLPRTGY